jgi:dolichol-phosphate mannosyltransferase/undecaprenyl-phosphate 4-deoxy-4-formamido-L-arabinose transferase
MSTDAPQLSIVIPVYRSATILPELHRRLLAALDGLGRSFEIVYVDDASPDDAWAVLEELRAGDDRVVLIQLMRNSGQQRALLTGLGEARGEFVVTMDDDLQHRPEEIGLLLDAITKDDLDAVIARFDSKKHGATRNLGSWAVKRLSTAALGIPPEFDLTAFRIMHQRVAHEIACMQRLNPVVGFLIFEVTRRVGSVEVHHDARSDGRSSYSRRALLDAMMIRIFDYTDWPLRFVGWVGATLSLASVALGIGYLVRWSLGRITVSGFTTLVLLTLFLSGFTLASLGILGSYLLRIHRQSQGDPAAVVRRTLRSPG